MNDARDKARRLIKKLRDRNFLLCFWGADYYAFVHRTFLEYFCAWKFVWQFEKERSISIEYLKTEVFGKHWQDETWHEVLLLIAGMIDAKFVGEIIDYLMVQDGEEEKFINLFLAAKCLLEVRNSSVIIETATKLLNQLKNLASQHNKDWQVRDRAVQELVYGWKDDPDTLSIFKQHAIDDDLGFDRQQAVYVLVKLWKDHPDTLPWIKERATKDNVSSIRGGAIRQLIREWKNDLSVFELLCNIAISDPFERQLILEDNPRQIALEAIIEQYPQHP